MLVYQHTDTLKCQHGKSSHDYFHHQFDSIEDMIEGALSCKKHWEDANSDLKNPAGDYQFIGRFFKTNVEIFEALRSQWAKGLEVYDQMMDKLRGVEFAAPRNLRRVKVWHEDEGDEVDVDRLRKGQPFWRSTHRSHRPGPATITIATDMATRATVNSSDILWRGAATICLTELLEQAGYRVEILAYDYVTDVFYDDRRKSHLLVSVSLKKPHDPLDVSTLINAVSGWAFRTLFFMSFHVKGGHISAGYGTPTRICETILYQITPDVKAMKCENLWSFDEAVKWITNQLAHIEEVMI